MGDKHYDVIVVGLGAMGSNVAFRLAKARVNVLGVDQFRPPHDMGSSHGRTRIIREAYFEDPRYVPLVRKAFENWEEIERLSGRQVFERTGGLMLGRPDGKVVKGALASAAVHKLAHEVLSATDVATRFPGIRPDEDMVGVVEPRAGIVAPETAVRAAIELAERYGATIVTENKVIGWRDDGASIRVVTQQGTYEAEKLVIAAGPWTRELLPGLDIPLKIERQVVNWFRPSVPTNLFASDRFPVVICEFVPEHFWYAFPDRGEGVKLAIHHDGVIVNVEDVNRIVLPDETAYIRELLRRFLPAADGPVIETSVCLYTNTPDEHFVIDAHPAHPNVTIISACSGHGFKFASAIGQVVAQQVTKGRTTMDVESFRYRW